jgi:hypothetical protein
VWIEDEELHGWLDLPSLIGVAILRAAPRQGKCVPPICNVNAVITCTHQTGIVKPLPRQTKVMIGGLPAMLLSSMMSTDCTPPVPNGTIAKFSGQTVVNAL